jgi:hypothetical protein
LEHEEVFAWQRDDNRVIATGSSRYGELEVTKDDSRRVAEYKVRLGEIVYFDLNGDGLLDALAGKQQPPMILVQNCFIEVNDSKGQFPRTKRAVETGIEYVFEGDRWRPKESKSRSSPRS